MEVRTDDGAVLFVDDRGPRTPIALVLLPPEPFGGGAWRHNVPVLADGLRAIAVDPRAHGRSPATPHGHTIRQYARDLHQVLRYLGVHAFVGVGWSLGVSVLWEYVARYGTGALRGIVEVDQPAWRAVPDTVLRERIGRIRTDRRRHHEAVVRAYFGPEVAPDDADVAWLVDECLRVPTEAHAAIVAESYRADYRPVLPAVDVPALLCWAEYGTLDGPLAQDIAALHPDCRTVHFPGVGHLLPFLAPAAFNETVLSFVRDVAERNAPLAEPHPRAGQI